MRGWDISYRGFLCSAPPERASTELPNFSWGLLIDGELQDPVVANVFWRLLTWNKQFIYKGWTCSCRGLPSPWLDTIWYQLGEGLLHVLLATTCNICFMEADPIHCGVSIHAHPGYDFAIIKKFTPSQDIGISGMIHQSPLNGIKHRMGHLHGWDFYGIPVWQSRRR